MTEVHEGGCLCGAVRFRATGAPKFISNCHCRSCRKATGAAYSTWVGFDAQRAEWVKGAPRFHASSPGVERGYCEACGTPLSYASDRWAGELHFLVGVFDNPEGLAPRKDVFVEDALTWAPRLKGETN